MACTTYVHFRHCTSEVSYLVIMSFDIVVDYVKTFGRVDLTCEHYVFTTKTLIHNYLIVPKMFFETVKFGDPASISQIDSCLL